MPLCCGVLASALCACGREPAPEPEESSAVLMRVEADPTISVSVSFAVGSQNDPAGKEGLAFLTGQMIADAATQNNTLDEILEKLYPLAAELRRARRPRAHDAHGAHASRQRRRLSRALYRRVPATRLHAKRISSASRATRSTRSRTRCVTLPTRSSRRPCCSSLRFRTPRTRIRPRERRPACAP